MSRVFTVNNNRKELVCDNCRNTILKGAGYRWTKSRYGPRKVRCLKASCEFRPSDLSSSKAAIIHDAINNAREEILTAELQDDIQSILQSVADTAHEVADEYQSASDAWAGGSNEEFQEKADQCTSFADELEGWSFNGEESEETVRESVRNDEDNARADDEDEDTYNERIVDLENEAWDLNLNEMREEASDVLDRFEL